MLIHAKSLFDVPVKNKEEDDEKGKNNCYTTGNLLDYEYISRHYKLIAVDLNKKLN